MFTEQEMKSFENKILNMDCLDFLKKCPDKYFSLILTDPPYEVDSHGGKSTQKGLGTRANNLRDNIRFVSDGFDYDSVFNEWIRICKKVNFYIFCSNRQISKIMSFFENLGYSTTLLVWHKTNAIPLANLTYHSDLEFIVCVRDKGSYFNNDATLKQKSKLYEMPFPMGDRLHPTQKPVDLIGQLLNMKSNENDLVLDCFSGSGTTAIACHRLKRRFICIERDYDYWLASCKRLEEEQRQGVLF